MAFFKLHLIVVALRVSSVASADCQVSQAKAAETCTDFKGDAKCNEMFWCVTGQCFQCSEQDSQCLSTSFCESDTAAFAEPCQALTDRAAYNPECFKMNLASVFNQDPKMYCGWKNYRDCVDGQKDGHGEMSRFVDPKFLAEVFKGQPEGWSHVRLEKPDHGTGPKTIFSGKLAAKLEVIFTCGCDPADKVGYFKANSNDMDGSKTQPTLRMGVPGANAQKKIDYGAMTNEMSQSMCTYFSTLEPGDYTGDNEIKCIGGWNRGFSLGTWIKLAR